MAPIKHLLNSNDQHHEQGMSPLSTHSYSPISDEETASKALNSSMLSSPSDMNSPKVSSDEESSDIHCCKWNGCDLEFNNPELLYHHLCQDHVGRKSQRNLQLNCQWGDCKTKTVKRDHITSHIRVHVPLKPFACSICTKKFKRPQDLKKHLKVHNEELSLHKKKRGPKPISKVDKFGADNRNYAHNKFTLPSITLDRFIHEDIRSQQPIYSQQLAEKLTNVLPLPVASASSCLLYTSRCV